MKQKPVQDIRSGSAKYVKIMGILISAVGIVILPALMITLVFAVQAEGSERVIFAFSGAAMAIGFLVLYGLFSLNVWMGTVIGLRTTDQVVYLTTKRRVFTYDVRMGCVAVVKKGKRFVCTFETQNSRDKFIFFLHAPFSKYSDRQFTEEDIRSFCPNFDEVLVEK